MRKPPAGAPKSGRVERAVAIARRAGALHQAARAAPRRRKPAPARPAATGRTETGAGGEKAAAAKTGDGAKRGAKPPRCRRLPRNRPRRSRQPRRNRRRQPKPPAPAATAARATAPKPAERGGAAETGQAHRNKPPRRQGGNAEETARARAKPGAAVVKPPPPSPAKPAPAAAKPPAPKPAQTAKPAQPKQVAAVPGEAIERDGGLTITFAPGSSDLPDNAVGALDRLAERLKSDPNMRIQLVGFARTQVESPSQARRLSLFRALSVRTHLMKKGVRSTRMDVRALGNKEDDGPPDRVDLVVPRGS